MTRRRVDCPFEAEASDLFPDDAAMDRAAALSRAFADRGVVPPRVTRAPALDPVADPSGRSEIVLIDETDQVTGSFKVRGALLALERIRARGVDRVIAASAGNHGAGVAFAAQALGVRATVVVPSVAPRAKRDKIAGFGAEIVVHDSPSYDVAEAYAIDLARSEGVQFLSAYDDADIVAGNGASLAFDALRVLGRVPQAVLVPFGGGGLATGLAYAFARAARDDFRETRRVWGAQSEASPTFAMSLEQASAVERFSASVPTLAEGLEGGIARDAFARARAALHGALVVTEDEIARAMAYAVRSLGRTVEGSGAAALAVVLSELPEPCRGGLVAVVLSGRNVDRERLESVLARGQ
jgi:threonine dehydratase